MKNNRFCKIIILVSIGAISYQSVYKWGFQGHRIINRMAVFTLPSEMSGFFKINIEYLTSNSTTPDSRRYSNKKEGAGHYIDLEFYNNVENLQKINWNKINELIPTDSLYKHGILPWRIIQYKHLLQKSFEEKSYKDILKYASELGHYISDALVPLHTTKNYNGQFTNQHGIHALWETKIVELIVHDINYFNSKAIYIENPTQFIWKIINQSHREIKIVLDEEKKLSETFNLNKYSFRKPSEKQTYSKEFIYEYNLKMNGLVEKKLKESILNLGSIWYTAWIDAGQPKLELNKFKFFNLQRKHECK